MHLLKDDEEEQNVKGKNVTSEKYGTKLKHIKDK